MDQSIPLWFLVAAAIFGLIQWIKAQKPGTPDDNRAVSAEHLRPVCHREGGMGVSAGFRNAGAVCRALGAVAAAGEVFTEVETSFRRAKIHIIAGLRNDVSEFKFCRLHHDAAGLAHGKKLGGVLIRRI